MRTILFFWLKKKDQLHAKYNMYVLKKWCDFNFHDFNLRSYSNVKIVKEHLELCTLFQILKGILGELM